MYKENATSTGVNEYILHGRNIIHMINGSDSLHFQCNVQNRPALVEHNRATYAYVYDLQGDVVALVDEAGVKVVECTYDWCQADLSLAN